MTVHSVGPFKPSENNKGEKVATAKWKVVEDPFGPTAGTQGLAGDNVTTIKRY